jgi:hypothetical protein
MRKGVMSMGEKKGVREQGKKNNSLHITHHTSHAMRSHKDLDAWKKSTDLVDSIYKVTKSFPNEELYSLTNQMRRAAISVPSNIAEGAARGSKNEFIQFLINGLIYSLKRDGGKNVH